MFIKLIKIIRLIINFLVIKSNKKVYIVPHDNNLADKYDLLNFSSDNVLCVLNYFYQNAYEFKSVFYLETYDKTRYDIIKKELENYPIKIVLLVSHLTEKNKFKKTCRRIKNTLIRYTCKFWISDTGSGNFDDKVFTQKIFCLSYSAPFKVGGCLMPNNLKKRSNWKFIDYFFETSLLTACIHSSEYKFNLESSPILGFPRNDYLFSNQRLSVVKKWIDSKVSFKYNKIIVYAPTYRDYEYAYKEGCVLGFNISIDELENFLSAHDYLLITKFHPLQKVPLSSFSQHILQYEKTYDFSLYDLLFASDMLISDYSSVIHDYILTGKPIVIDAFDLNKYNNTRGFVFEPIEYVLPSKPCMDFLTLINEIESEFKNSKRNIQYYSVQKMFHRYIDNNSSERVANFLKRYLR